MNKADIEATGIGHEREAAHGGGVFTFSERVEFLKKFGRHSMSFSAFQPKMCYFDMEDVGYIAYRKQWGSVVCLGNPVCSEADRETLIRAFCKKYSNPVFIQVTQAVADLIHEITGFYATQFGKETLIDLNAWTMSGKKKTSHSHSG
jgi:phosphatidylglycerol lysyltransferase